ncbi:Flp pilus assembly protein TadB [Desulfohalotomaculum tongense]|uniref:type II secretion system F family protein n=1 Tax=Desulforadius tongensis TaxID=1216062 RepID=UPI00195D004A|nr:hypothetical protein [Desulforadius tongensis]MBM7854940.1 Flp pilus assembly protein TadB [Desulforadius tongensis]
MHGNELLLNGVIFISFTVLLILTLNLFLSMAGATVNKVLLWKKERDRILAMPEVARNLYVPKNSIRLLNAYSNRIDKGLSNTGFNISTYKYMLITVIMPLVGTFLVYFIFQDILMSVTALVLFIILPLMYLNRATRKHKRKINEQLPAALQLFGVEFELTRNLRESLARAAEGVSNPLRKHIIKCVNDLNASKAPKRAFERFAANINNEYGKLWAQLLYAATKDANIIKVLPRIVRKLNMHRLLIEKNITQLSGERRIGIILNMLIIPGFFIVLNIFPDTTLEFYNRPFGRIIILLAFLSFTVGLILDNVLKKVNF